MTGVTLPSSRSSRSTTRSSLSVRHRAVHRDPPLDPGPVVPGPGDRAGRACRHHRSRHAGFWIHVPESTRTDRMATSSVISAPDARTVSEPCFHCATGMSPRPTSVPLSAESSTRDAGLLGSELPKHSATWLAPLASFGPVDPSTESFLRAPRPLLDCRRPDHIAGAAASARVRPEGAAGLERIRRPGCACSWKPVCCSRRSIGLDVSSVRPD